MAGRLMKYFSIIIIFVLVIQLAACGTILYPERRGQTSGRIDPGVAILDGIGLLFFVIPGIIAFAVDFTTGTIYLPGTARSSLEREKIRHVRFDPERCDLARLEMIIKKETGHDVGLDGDNVIVSRVNSTDEMMMHFAEVLPEMHGARTVISMK
jgi:hypothetical protein